MWVSERTRKLTLLRVEGGGSIGAYAKGSGGVASRKGSVEPEASWSVPKKNERSPCSSSDSPISSNGELVPVRDKRGSNEEKPGGSGGVTRSSRRLGDVALSERRNRGRRNRTFLHVEVGSVGNRDVESRHGVVPKRRATGRRCLTKRPWRKEGRLERGLNPIGRKRSRRTRTQRAGLHTHTPNMLNRTLIRCPPSRSRKVGESKDNTVRAIVTTHKGHYHPPAE